VNQAIKQGFLIPVYNHGAAVGKVVTDLSKYALPIIMVDDGSDEDTKRRLAEIVSACPLTVLITKEKNFGKGGAVYSGLEKAWELGLTHVLQIDADGQHDTERAGFFLAESAARPDALICGLPEYDDSVPLSRKNGRKVANIWANIVTLSGGIKDALCGFRVYPVEKTRRLYRRVLIDRRMGFDAEILVRLQWQGVPLVFYPVRVTYPKDGISYFHMVRDNIRISWVFTRLCCGLLVRLPLLLYRRLRKTPSEQPAESRPSRPSHWSEYKEEAAGYWHLKLTLILFRLLPAVILRIIVFPVSFCYYVFSRRAREESRRFLEKAASARIEVSLKKLHPLKHITSFSLSLVEKVEAWGGKVPFKRICFQDDDAGTLIKGLENGEGALLLTSHLGNMEFLRALADFGWTGLSRPVGVNILFDFTVTAQFNRMLRELNPASMVRVLNVNNIGPDTVILLQERLAAGELVAIAGDRTSVNTPDRYLRFPFLGEEASFPYGPFFLAAVLGAPVYFVFALRQRDISFFPAYNMHIHRCDFSFDCSRREREGRIRDLAGLFAKKLEYYCKQYPYQWYNFYDFWVVPT
jgi:predicted LPLAT superfamily acyltransferase